MIDPKDLEEGSIVVYGNTPVVITKILPSSYTVVDSNGTDYTAFLNQLDPIDLYTLFPGVECDDVVLRNGIFYYFLEDCIRIGKDDSSAIYFRSTLPTHIIQKQYLKQTTENLTITL